MNSSHLTSDTHTPAARTSRGLKALVVAFALAATGLVGGNVAHASAYSCTGYGLGVPKIGQTSQFCADTKGSGLRIDSIGAGFSAPIGWAGVLCNTRVKAEFIDTRGVVYATFLSSQQNGCSMVGAWKWTVNGYARQGTLRYTLLSNGVQIAAVQQTIKP